ncbi:DUF6346 domain-containing protein [Saccharopolyspora griseoalba]|uniref:DUF6346 domain-containing protein n=1 Tax=Saccharopolyspora griseoalba TaxID=1431848 RepID=A0ABW2LML8_9PSEU
MRTLRLLVGLVGVTAILLTTLTVTSAIPRRTTANATAVATSCEAYGPISRRGFGTYWACNATMTDTKSGKRWTDVVDIRSLTPEDIGKKMPISWGHQRGRAVISDKRVYSSPDGYGQATYVLLLSLSYLIGGFAAVLLLTGSVLAALTRQGRRTLLEKSLGTPEERAAKKQRDKAEDEEWQQKKARIAEANRRNKEARRQAKEARKSDQ